MLKKEPQKWWYVAGGTILVNDNPHKCFMVEEVEDVGLICTPLCDVGLKVVFVPSIKTFSSLVGMFSWPDEYDIVIPMSEKSGYATSYMKCMLSRLSIVGTPQCRIEIEVFLKPSVGSGLVKISKEMEKKLEWIHDPTDRFLTWNDWPPTLQGER